MKLLGINGFAMGGKDSIREWIELNKNYDGYAFAAPIKEAAAIMLDMPLKYFYDTKLKEEIMPFWGFSPRVFLQKLGTEFARDMMHKDFWIKRAESTWLKTQDSDFSGLVISDARFENEFAWIRSQGGGLIKVVRPDFHTDVPEHDSEIDWPDSMFDEVIINDGTLTDLYNKIAHL